MEYTPPRKRNKDLLIWPLFFVAMGINLIAVVRFPTLSEKTWFSLLIQLLMALPTVLFAILKKEKSPLLLRILLGMFGISWFLPLFVTYYKTYLIVMIALLWTSAICASVYCIYPLCERYKCPGMKSNIGIACLFHMAFIITDINSYEYIEKNSFRYIIPIIVITAIITAVSVFLSMRGYIRLKDDRLSERIAIIICALFASAALTWVSASHLNYALDGSGQTHEKEVIEKYYDMNGDGKYRLAVDIDGKTINIEVSKDAYNSIEKGETIKLKYYDGAFGEAFYLK